MLNALRRLLNIREEELGLIAVLGGYTFLTTAALIVLSSAKNGLFLSVYPARLIPHVIIASALVTAVLAVGFAGMVGLLSRRRLGDLAAAVFAGSLVLFRLAFAAAPGTAFLLYLWLSVVGVLAVTQMWGTIGDHLTGRQARRVLPLVGAGGSIAGALTGFALGPAALALGTPNLLLVAAVLLAAPVPLLRLVRAPERVDAGRESKPGARGRARPGSAFVASVRRGFHSVGEERLLKLVALAVALTLVISTVVDYQFKAMLQRGYTRDGITAFYGILSGAVGLATFVLQFAASRVLFPRFGLSAGSLTQAGAIGTAATALLALGSFWLVVVLRFLDDALRFSFQKTIEQVSLAPYPPGVKGPAQATITGVVRPVSQAAAGVLLLLLAPVLGVSGLSLVTALAAGAMIVLFLRYRGAYLEALERALARRTLSLAPGTGGVPLLDRNAYALLDRALAGDDPAVVVFGISLLRGAPPAEARQRLVRLLDHPVAEVRTEAVLALADVEDDAGAARDLAPLVARLATESSPAVLATLLQALGGIGDGIAAPTAERFTEHADAAVRREALVLLVRREGAAGGPARRRLDTLLASPRADDRVVALGAVAALRDASELDAVVRGVEDPATRAAALHALTALGPAAIPALDALLGRPDLETPVRRALISALASIEDERAHARLLELLHEPALAGAVLVCLGRLRRAGRMPAVPPATVQPFIEAEVRQGLRHEVLGEALRRAALVARTAAAAPEPDAGARHGALSHRQAVPAADAVERTEFAASALLERHRRAVYRVLALLGLAHDPARLAAVGDGLFSDDPHSRSDALELLEGLLEPELAPTVIPLVDTTPVMDRVLNATHLIPEHRQLRARPLEGLLAERDPWLRACGAFVLAAPEPDRNAMPALALSDGDLLSEEETAMLPLIEKVLFLKGSSLFRALPGEELGGVARVAEVVHAEAGDVLFREGEPGDAFYLVLSGRVRIERAGREIAVLGSREGLGEMALLDREPRSATATADAPSTLLRIDRDSFDALVERNPAIARGIYRVLSQRLRATLEQVAGAPELAVGSTGANVAVRAGPD